MEREFIQKLTYNSGALVALEFFIFLNCTPDFSLGVLFFISSDRAEPREPMGRRAVGSASDLNIRIAINYQKATLHIGNSFKILKGRNRALHAEAQIAG